MPGPGWPDEEPLLGQSLDGSQSAHTHGRDEQPDLEHHSGKDRKLKREMTGGTSAAVLDSADAEKNLEKFEAPTSFELVMMYMALTLGYTAYMMTSWMEATLRHKILFPTCGEYWTSWGTMGPVVAGSCVGSVMIYWLFPLFVSVIILMFFFRDLLLTRLYYIMFTHAVHLDFSNVSFFQAPAVRVMLVWCALCLTMYPLAGTIGFRQILQTFSFWVPVMSCAGMLYTQWDIETRLVSVSKLVEEDSEWAGNHVRNSFFLRDYVAEEAFRRVRDRFEKQNPAPELKTSQYIFQIACEAEKLQHLEKDVRGLKKLKKDLKKKSTHSIFWAVTPWFWPYQFLYCRFLVDEEAKRFHFWFRIYFWFFVVLMLIFLFLSISTIVAVLIMQNVIVLPASLDFNWIGWLAKSDHSSANFLAMPTHGSPQSQGFMGTGFMQFFTLFKGETQAFEAEIAALQQQNAALLAEVASLKAGALCP